jgi:hypothetical protein
MFFYGIKWTSAICFPTEYVEIVDGTASLYLYSADYNSSTTKYDIMNLGLRTLESDGSITISQAPVPGAVWMFGPGLGLFAWLRRKKNQRQPVYRVV